MQLGKRYVCEQTGVEIVVTKGGEAVIVCGSLYVVGEARAHLVPANRRMAVLPKPV